MVNKTKNEKNKRRYNKNKTKKMYGGDTEYTMPPPKPVGVDKPPPKIPTLNENLKKFQGLADTFGNVALSLVIHRIKDSIEKVAKKIGIDPNQPLKETIKEISIWLNNVVEALNTPEGEKLKQHISVLALQIVDILKPSVDEEIGRAHV